MRGCSQSRDVLQVSIESLVFVSHLHSMLLPLLPPPLHPPPLQCLPQLARLVLANAEHGTVECTLRCVELLTRPQNVTPHSASYGPGISRVSHGEDGRHPYSPLMSLCPDAADTEFDAECCRRLGALADTHWNGRVRAAARVAATSYESSRHAAHASAKTAGIALASHWAPLSANLISN